MKESQKYVTQDQAFHSKLKWSPRRRKERAAENYLRKKWPQHLQLAIEQQLSDLRNLTNLM